MENKRQQLYRSVFEAVRDQMPGDAQGGPEFFSDDFELASTNAFKMVFPNSTEAFCFFTLLNHSSASCKQMVIQEHT